MSMPASTPTPTPVLTERPIAPPPPLWRNANYLLLWAGQATSSIGSQVSLIAFPFLVLALTGSPAQAGLMGALRAVPYLLFSLPAGALIDRWDRKRVMIFCDAGRALALGSIPVALVLTRHVSLTQLYLISAVEGTLFVFFNIAEVSCLPRVVPPEQLPAASAQNAATDGVSSLIGPSLGGALFGLAAALPFVADAVSYAVSVATLSRISARFQGDRATPRRALRHEIGEGLAWLWRQPLIRFTAFSTGMNNLLSAGSVLLLILLARRLHATDLAIGLIFTIGGVGGILGALVAPRLHRHLRYRTLIIAPSLVWTLAWAGYALAPSVLVLGMLTALIFFVGTNYNVAQISYRLALIPDALQGRVNSAFRLIAFSGQPIGLALTGVALEHFGPIVTDLGIAAALLFLLLLTAINPHVRHAPALADIKPA